MSDLPEVAYVPEDPFDDVVSELVPFVKRIVDDLPHDYRQALLLTEYEGLTQRELAERLGISISGAKSRVQRAREKVKRTALASLGCGNPTALAELKAGERVLDLGSGGGIDVLLSAKRVGPNGFAYGLDMTDAMLELAERNRAESNVENVRFLKGVIENIPLPANAVDVVISNCVINLSADKGQVIHEAYRVLSPGGRFAVSDIVFLGHFPSAIRNDLEAWAACTAGALEEGVYRQLLAEAGFVHIEIEVTRRYSIQDVADSGGSSSIASLTEQERAEIDGKFVSAFIRAQKPI